VGNRLAGLTPGVLLNEHGRVQAQALADRLVEAPIKAIYSSPLERAQETAQAVASRHGLSVQTVAGMIEVGCGDWTGQSIEELAKTDLWRTVQVYPSGFRFPNGEAMTEVQARAVTAIDALRAQHPGELIAVFSHSDVIKLVTTFYLGMPLDLFQRLVINPASITEFSFTAFGPRLLRCNDCAHLPPDPEKKDEDAETAKDTEAQAVE
jgi:probable phosphoglycerate mutase